MRRSQLLAFEKFALDPWPVHVNGTAAAGPAPTSAATTPTRTARLNA
jgi:hypothetical protein